MAATKLLGVNLLALILLPAALAQPGIRPPRRAALPVTDLERNADLIAIARIDQVVGNGLAAPLTIHLRIVRILQGQSTSLDAFAEYALPALTTRIGITWAQTAVGKTGIWFLKSGTGNYQVLPRVREGYTYDTDLFLPVADSLISTPPTGTMDQQLLAYLVGWYQSLSNPTVGDDSLLLNSLELGGPLHPPSQQDALTAVAPLIASSSPAQHAVGITAALRLGSADALSTVIKELPNLRSNSRFPNLMNAILIYPKDPSWLPGLQQLLQLHADVPGLDSALAAALVRIGTKAVLPSLAELLDSKDPLAQRTVENYFGKFTALADVNGVIPSSGTIPTGAFWTEQTRQFSPGDGSSSISAAQYAAFWKSWWADHRAQLGFATQ